MSGKRSMEGHGGRSVPEFRVRYKMIRNAIVLVLNMAIIRKRIIYSYVYIRLV